MHGEVTDLLPLMAISRTKRGDVNVTSVPP